jgi:hypothetical protein
MQTDELRRELRQLADEMEPFSSDLPGLRHREGRRSALLRVAAALVVVLTVAGAVALWNRGEKHVGVAKKEYSQPDVRLDLVVVPGTERVREILEDSPVVARYAALDRGGLAVPPDMIVGPAAYRDAACALRKRDGFAVQTKERGASDLLSRVLGNDAKVFVVSTDPIDAEVFMKVNATRGQAQAVLTAISSDTKEIRSFRYLDHNAAYAEFKRVFADQPALIESTTPDVLPESFRLAASDGTPSQVLVRRFEHLAGVDKVIAARSGAPDWSALSRALGALSTDHALGALSNSGDCRTP